MQYNSCVANFRISTVVSGEDNVGRIIAISAAAHHSVVLSESRAAYTFGRHTEGQLLRFASKDSTAGWNAVAGRIAGSLDLQVELALACENATLILYNRRLLSNEDLLSTVDASANRNYLLLTVGGKRGGSDRWLIDKRNSTVRCIRNAANQLAAFDPLHSVIWTYDRQLHEMTVETQN